jgi:hypothetical protein
MLYVIKQVQICSSSELIFAPIDLKRIPEGQLQQKLNIKYQRLVGLLLMLAGC